MKIFRYWKPVLVSLVIFYGSVTSSNNLNSLSLLNFEHSDKLVHFTLYLVFSITLNASFKHNTQQNSKTRILLTLFLGILYGSIMEVIQYSFTTTRSAEVLDIFANTLGCIIGILIFELTKKYSFSKYL